MLLMWVLINKHIYKYREDFIRFFKWLYRKVKPYLTWHFLLCFGIAWMVSNGWAYIFFFVGKALLINWMFSIGASYLAFIYMPWSLEKPIITIPLARFLVRKIFPNDFHIIKLLDKMKEKYK